MTREWKPGVVAMVAASNRREGFVATFDGKYWREHGEDWSSAVLIAPTSVRPLAVIDPESREEVERLAVAYAKQRRLLNPEDISRVDDLQAALREFATPIPQIEEPTGLGAVVAGENDEIYVRIGVHDGDSTWSCVRTGTPFSWLAIGPTRVLSEGYEVQP